MMTINSIITLGDQRPAVVPSKRYPNPDIKQAAGLQVGHWCANHFSN